MKLVQIGTVYVDAGMVMISGPCYGLPDTAGHRAVAATGVGSVTPSGPRRTQSPSDPASPSSCGHCTAMGGTR